MHRFSNTYPATCQWKHKLHVRAGMTTVPDSQNCDSSKIWASYHVCKYIWFSHIELNKWLVIQISSTVILNSRIHFRCSLLNSALMLSVQRWTTCKRPTGKSWWKFILRNMSMFSLTKPVNAREVHTGIHSLPTQTLNSTQVQPAPVVQPPSLPFQTHRVWNTTGQSITDINGRTSGVVVRDPAHNPRTPKRRLEPGNTRQDMKPEECITEIPDCWIKWNFTVEDLGTADVKVIQRTRAGLITVPLCHQVTQN